MLETKTRGVDDYRENKLLKIQNCCRWREVEAESGLRLAHIAGSLDLAQKDAARAAKVTMSYKEMRKQNIS